MKIKVIKKNLIISIPIKKLKELLEPKITEVINEVVELNPEPIESIEPVIETPTDSPDSIV
jgi:hypothetical protein